ncbi:MAG: hypothetical protein RIT01_591 [Pseudomonadota bacterium]|jgi:hypothetical protein
MNTTKTSRKLKSFEHDLTERAAAQIIISAGPYGFGRTWELSAYGKRFYLGQDAKVCSRLLGLDPQIVIQKIGGNNISDDQINNNLAVLIINEIKLDAETAAMLEPWAFACD